MAFKSRIERDELKGLRLLNARMELSVEDKKALYRLDKGFEGEQKFDLWTDKLPENRFLVLNDLQLKVNNHDFQIDASAIVQGTYNFFEVKNYEGDYEFDAKTGRLYLPGGDKEILDPLDQMKRCESLLRQLLQEIRFNIPIKMWLIFINPEFHLYNAPKNPSIIYPTQIHRFMKALESNVTGSLNTVHYRLAEKLVSLHHIEPAKLPKVEWSKPRKGILCYTCLADFMNTTGVQELVCLRCGAREKTADAVMRSVQEILLLYPGMKITTNVVYEWCGGSIGSKQIVRRILQRNMKAHGIGQWTFYEF